MSNGSTEQPEAGGLGFDEEVLALIRARLPAPLVPLTLEGRGELAGFEPERFVGRWERTDEPNEIRLELDVLASAADRRNAPEMVASLQRDLQARGYQALTTCCSHTELCRIYAPGVLPAGAQTGKVMLVFFQAEDPASLLWVRQTNGASFGVSTRDILRRLDAWKERCQFTLLGAGRDWVDLRFFTLPENIESFAEEIYRFCPATLDRGILHELPEDIQRIGTASLEEVSEEDLVNLMDFMEESLERQQVSDLAEYLVRKKRLVLWWA